MRSTYNRFFEALGNLLVKTGRGVLNSSLNSGDKDLSSSAAWLRRRKKSQEAPPPTENVRRSPTTSGMSPPQKRPRRPLESTRQQKENQAPTSPTTSSISTSLKKSPSRTTLASSPGRPSARTAITSSTKKSPARAHMTFFPPTRVNSHPLSSPVTPPSSPVSPTIIYKTPTTEQTVKQPKKAVHIVGMINADWKFWKYSDNFGRNTKIDTYNPLIPVIDSFIGTARFLLNLKDAINARTFDFDINGTHYEILDPYISNPYQKVNTFIEIAYAIEDLITRYGRSIKIAIYFGAVVGNAAEFVELFANVMGMVGLGVAISKFIYDFVLDKIRQKKANEALLQAKARIAVYEQLLDAIDNGKRVGNLDSFVKSENEKHGVAPEMLRTVIRLLNAGQNNNVKDRHAIVALLAQCEFDAQLHSKILEKIQEESNSDGFKIARLLSIAVSVLFFNIIKSAAVAAAVGATTALPVIGWVIMVFWGIADKGRRELKNERGKVAFEKIEAKFNNAINYNPLLNNNPRLKALVSTLATPFLYVAVAFTCRKKEEWIPALLPMLLMGVGIALITLAKITALSGIVALPIVGWTLVGIMLVTYMGSKLAEDNTWCREKFQSWQNSVNNKIEHSAFFQNHQSLALVVTALAEPVMHFALVFRAIAHVLELLITKIKTKIQGTEVKLTLSHSSSGFFSKPVRKVPSYEAIPLLTNGNINRSSSNESIPELDTGSSHARRVLVF